MIHNQTFPEILNVTIPITKTDQCLSFCQEQVNIQAQNSQIEGMFLILIGVGFLTIYKIFKSTKYERIKNISLDGAILFTLGFLIWFVITT